VIRDITLGQYYDTESPIHKMDPRTKILITLIYMIVLFVVNGVLSYLSLIVFTGIVIWFSNIPLKFITKGLKPILFLVIITALLNLFMTPGNQIIFSVGIFKITDEGILMASKMAIRIILLILGTSILTLTTTPTVLTGGMEILLSPLKKLKIPISMLVMMMSIALRFIPTLIDETDKIIKAQTSRGADFEHGNPIRRVKALIPILIPLFVSAFRRAEELAIAMECRCYNADAKRSSFKRFSFKKYDFYAFALTIILLLILIVLKVVQ